MKLCAFFFEKVGREIPTVVLDGEIFKGECSDRGKRTHETAREFFLFVCL